MGAGGGCGFERERESKREKEREREGGMEGGRVYLLGGMVKFATLPKLT